MRGIAFMLASALVVAGFAAATAEEPVAPAPIKLAVFPFELEDFSAAAAYHPPDDIDREQLRLSTEEARRLIAESGRYKLVDVGAVERRSGESGKIARLRRLRSQDRRRRSCRPIDDWNRHAHQPHGLRGDLQNSRRSIRSAGRCRADRPARGRQFGLEPWRALADPAPSAGKAELAPPTAMYGTAKEDPEKERSHEKADETIICGPRLACRRRLLRRSGSAKPGARRAAGAGRRRNPVYRYLGRGHRSERRSFPAPARIRGLVAHRFGGERKGAKRRPRLSAKCLFGWRHRGQISCSTRRKRPAPPIC